MAPPLKRPLGRFDTPASAIPMGDFSPSQFWKAPYRTALGVQAPSPLVDCICLTRIGRAAWQIPFSPPARLVLLCNQLLYPSHCVTQRATESVMERGSISAT